jgi:hypothetical protein
MGKRSFNCKNENSVINDQANPEKKEERGRRKKKLEK